MLSWVCRFGYTSVISGMAVELACPLEVEAGLASEEEEEDLRRVC